MHLAHGPANRPAIEVGLVQVHPTSDGILRNIVDSIHSNSPTIGPAHGSPKYSTKQSILPPPTFGSSPNLEALAIEANNSHVQDGDGDDSVHASAQYSRPMHEITFPLYDKPKLLSQLTYLLIEIGLNIQEAHVFSIVDGYTLDVFVVMDGHTRKQSS